MRRSKFSCILGIILAPIKWNSYLFREWMVRAFMQPSGFFRMFKVNFQLISKEMNQFANTENGHNEKGFILLLLSMPRGNFVYRFENPNLETRHSKQFIFQSPVYHVIALRDQIKLLLEHPVDYQNYDFQNFVMNTTFKFRHFELRL